MLEILSFVVDVVKIPVVRATLEAKVGGSLEPKSSRIALVT